MSAYFLCVNKKNTIKAKHISRNMGKDNPKFASNGCSLGSKRSEKPMSNMRITDTTFAPAIICKAKVLSLDAMN